MGRVGGSPVEVLMFDLRTLTKAVGMSAVEHHRTICPKVHRKSKHECRRDIQKAVGLGTGWGRGKQ